MTTSCRLLLILSILAIMVIVFILIARNELFHPSGLGRWGDKRYGDCIVESGSCEDEGRMAEIQECIQSTGGKGCELPDGNITSATWIKYVPCYLPCKSSIWNVDVGQCQSGSRRTLYTCIEKDRSGQNYCSLNLIEPSGYDGTEVPPCYQDTASPQAIAPTLFPVGYSCYVDTSC